MNFGEFSQLVKFLRQNYVCPACHEKFSNEDIHILGGTDEEGLFLVECLKCNGFMVVGVGIDAVLRYYKHIYTQRTPRRINQERQSQPITKDDILDMHNLLKYHSGDLSKYL